MCWNLLYILFLFSFSLFFFASSISLWWLREIEEQFELGKMCVCVILCIGSSKKRRDEDEQGMKKMKKMKKMKRIHTYDRK